MNRNLLGQETELAIRFEPHEGVLHPGNKVLFEYVSLAIKSLVRTKPGKRSFIQDQFFTENGGAIYYEHHPQSLRKGLIEFATPECSNAYELVLYQRAQEKLLENSLSIAQKLLDNEGFHGELGFIKNSRDFLGNTYGTQENYDAFIARGWRRILLTIGLITYLPFSILSKLLYIVLLIPFVFLIFLFKVGIEFMMLISHSFIGHKLLGGARYLRRMFHSFVKLNDSLNHEDQDTEEYLLKFEYGLFYPLFWLSYRPLITIYNFFAFKSQQQATESFLISRIIFTGAGSLVRDEHFCISEKGEAITGKLRKSIHRLDKPLFDCGNLIKEYELAVWELFLFRTESFKSLFKKRQRFQIAFSDSNRCQLAEILKMGITALIVRFADEGHFKNAPRLERVESSIAIISQDLDFNRKIPLKNGSSMSALEIQRWYLQEVKVITKADKIHDMEVQDLIKLWEETLDRLSQDPLSLVGRLDWVTKKYLLSEAGSDLSFLERKKIDIRYHEIGKGYFERLQERGLTLDFFTPEEIEEAITKPSSPKRVRLRSRLIKSLAFQHKSITVSWNQVKVGRWRPKVIHLDDFRPKNLRDL